MGRRYMNMKHIFLVEDDPFLSEMYAKKISAAGFEIEVIGTAEEALRKLEQIKPDLILLDIVLPKMDGFEFLRTIKQNEVYQKIPVLVLSNVGQKEEIQRGLELGAKGYIVKAQFTPSEIIQKINQALS